MPASRKTKNKKKAKDKAAPVPRSPASHGGVFDPPEDVDDESALELPVGPPPGAKRTASTKNLEEMAKYQVRGVFYAQQWKFLHYSLQWNTIVRFILKIWIMLEPERDGRWGGQNCSFEFQEHVLMIGFVLTLGLFFLQK